MGNDNQEVKERVTRVQKPLPYIKIKHPEEIWGGQRATNFCHSVTRPEAASQTEEQIKILFPFPTTILTIATRFEVRNERGRILIKSRFSRNDFRSTPDGTKKQLKKPSKRAVSAAHKFINGGGIKRKSNDSLE